MKEVSELIRGEISAVESINVVLRKIDNVKDRETLRNIREDHVQAVEKLKRYAGAEYDYNAEETRTSGPWGTFAETFTGGASFFGDKAAIKALKVGEEHGVKEYRELLRNSDLNEDIRRVVETDLLPKQEAHLTTIEKYIQ